MNEIAPGKIATELQRLQRLLPITFANTNEQPLGGSPRRSDDPKSISFWSMSITATLSFCSSSTVAKKNTWGLAR